MSKEFITNEYFVSKYAILRQNHNVLIDKHLKELPSPNSFVVCTLHRKGLIFTP